jgi:hypothetical protein
LSDLVNMSTIVHMFLNMWTIVCMLVKRVKIPGFLATVIYGRALV